MSKPRKILWLMIFLFFLAAFVDFPAEIPLDLRVGKWELKKTLRRPPLDLHLGSVRVRRELEIKKGLDLAGGSHLVFQTEMKDIPSGDQDKALEAARNVIERRINFYGVAEPVIQTAKVGGDFRIIVELPGVTDVGQAVDLIGKTAQLVFKEEEPAVPEATPSAAIPTTKETGLTGKHLKRAQVRFDSSTGKPEVGLEFSSEGAKLFEEITQRNVGKQVAIFLDNQIISAPRVNEVISGGEAVITGQFSLDEAKNLVIQLNAGALPVPIKIIEQRNIGATLGQISVEKSLIAGLIGLSMVIIFMALYYGLLGFLADLALVIYALLVLALFKTIPVTLTLAGIAGFILSIGMAVDANILIFERMKEETRWGKKREVALELGFSRAWSSIRDSNVSSLLTCGILYYFGSGIVRGFALTLALGILVSMFTAIVMTRTFLRLIYR